jgi:hypothetical protein
MENRQEREPREQGPENEIRVSFKTDVLRAVERAAAAFNNFEKVTFSAINSGISKLILIVEITKIKIEGLHQINHLESLTKDRKDQNGETRQGFLTNFKVELSKSKPTVPAGWLYQAPYTHEHIEAVRSVKTEERDDTEPRRGGRGRGRGRGFRGGRGGFQPRPEGQEFEGERRGGRGGRGRGRGGFRGPRPEGQEFDGERRGGRGGRGRGRGGFRGGVDRPEGERSGFRGGRGGERGAFRGGRGGERGAFRGGRGQEGAPQQTAPVQTRTTIPGLNGPRAAPRK